MDLSSPPPLATLEDLRRAWGTNVRTARTDAGLTQQSLAVMCNVQTSTVSRIEAGKWSPGDILRMQLAAALGTSVSKLFPHDLTAETEPAA